jgi:DNA repair exonuclease SbcCD nuclease subunit
MFFSDTHLKDFGSFPPFNKVEENGFTRELNNILIGFEWVAKQIIEYKPSLVMLLGDLYHTPEGLSTTVITASDRALTGIKNACAEVGAVFVITKGNHDVQNEPLGINSICTLGGYGTILLENTVYKLKDDNKITKIGVVQFNSDEDLITKDLRIMEKKCDLMVTHLDFKSAEYENGFKSESEIDANFSIPVVSGDLHATQRVGSVYYPGSLVQNRFTRNDTEKVGGVLMWDSATNEFLHLPNTASYHYVKIDDIIDLQKIDPKFNVILQIKCEVDDLSIFEGYDFIYIPVHKKNETGMDENTPTRLNFGTPFSMLRKYTSNNRPEAVEFLDSVIKE